MRNREERHQKPYNLEFGMEFGDINASKLYEMPCASKKDKQTNNKKK